MIRPLLQLMASEPELLAEHLQSYAELLGDEVGSFQGQLRQRWTLWAILALLVTVTVIFAGIALMLWLVTPGAPWTLWLVPGFMVVLCLVTTWFITRHQHTPGFLVLRQQIAADLAMLRQADAAP
jgi:type VI protein secretion system component VasK